MSAPGWPVAPDDDLILDPGILSGSPILEVGGWHAAERTFGSAVLWWRAHDRAAATVTLADLTALPRVSEAVVRIGKGKTATWADAALAWSCLSEGGRLLIVGTNTVGISTWGDRLSATVGQPGIILANRRRSRVIAFTKSTVAFPRMDASHVPLSLDNDQTLTVPPGVFSADGLDRGTAVMLRELADLPLPTPSVIVDVGCGAGHLGFAAAQRFTQAKVHLLDADRRAVAAASANAGTLGLSERCHARWWDEIDPWPEPADLILLNPPAHAGVATDLEGARKLFIASANGLAPSGRLLVVANRHLAYERDLARLGTVTTADRTDGFKILTLIRESWYRDTPASATDLE